MIQFKRVFVLLPVLMLGGCELTDDAINGIFRYFLLPTKTTVISQGLDLDEHWQEIIPDPPLKVSKSEQEIEIQPPGNLNWELRRVPGGHNPNKGPTVPLPLPYIKVQLVSEHGTIYPLNSISSVTSTGIGFSYWSEDDDLASHRELPKGGDPTHSHYRDLPKDVAFTKVRIRSEKPVKTGEISWVRFSYK